MTLDRDGMTFRALADIVEAGEGGVGAHALVGALHTAAGLTAGHFLKALSATTFGFAAHGLSYADVGAAAASHGHSPADVAAGNFPAGAFHFEGNVTTQGDTYYLCVRNTAGAGVLYAGTEKAWRGAGSVTDLAIGSNAKITFWSNGRTTVDATLDSGALTLAGAAHAAGGYYAGDASSQLWLGPWGGSNYLQSANADFTGNAPLYISGWNTNIGSNLFIRFALTRWSLATDYNLDLVVYGGKLAFQPHDDAWANWIDLVIHGITAKADATTEFAASVVLVANQAGLFFTDLSGTHPILVCQTDNNFVFYGTNATGASRGIWSIFQRSSTSAFNVAVDLQVNLLGVFDSATAPATGQLLSWNTATANKWAPATVQLGVSSGVAFGTALGDGSTVALFNTSPTLNGTPVTPSAAPGTEIHYHAIAVDMSATVLPAGCVYVLYYSKNGGGYGGEIMCTGDRVVHSNLDPAATYAYKYLIRGATDSGYSPATGALNPGTSTSNAAFGLIAASQIAAQNLAAISADLGTITAGIINYPASSPTQGIRLSSGYGKPGTWKRYLDLAAVTSAYFLYCEDAYGHVAFSLTAEGAAQFTGTVNVLGDLLVWANAGPPLGSQGATLHPIHNAWETGLDIQDASAVSLLKLESMNADTACPLATFKGRIKHDGTYGIVCANAALPANATGGFLYIPTCAGTPTGTPVAQSGCVALLFDVDNYRLYVYDNGSWRGVTLSA